MTGSEPASFALRPIGADHVSLVLTGDWRVAPPDTGDLAAALERLAARRATSARLSIDAKRLRGWDSPLVASLRTIEGICQRLGIAVERGTLPVALVGLLDLAGTPPATPAPAPESRASLARRAGLDAIDLARSTGEIMAFLGEVSLALARWSRGRARLGRAEFWLIAQDAGVDALPIVGLVSFLVGMILGYIGDQQLARFGARIFVADLVGLAMVIQIGALITAIVLAGRTGAAFAARLGSMQVNEEIDALRTLGIAPLEFLVLPRMLALVAMTPLLAIYADVLGVLGGAFVGTLVGGLSLTEYLGATRNAIAFNHIAQGLISAIVYGAIVAASGCLRGLQCGRSAAAVGDATTSAVVTALVFIVIAAAILTIVFDATGLS